LLWRGGWVWLPHLGRPLRVAERGLVVGGEEGDERRALDAERGELLELGADALAELQRDRLHVDELAARRCAWVRLRRRRR